MRTAFMGALCLSHDVRPARLAPAAPRTTRQHPSEQPLRAETPVEMAHRSLPPSAHRRCAEDTTSKSRTVGGSRESFAFSRTSWSRDVKGQMPRQRLAARHRTVAAGSWRRYTSAVAAWPSATAVRGGASALTLLAVLIAAVT